MARRKITLDEKIEKQKQIVFKAKEHYDAAVAELNELNKRRDELRKKELLEAISSSKRSYEEILRFLQTTDENDENELPVRYKYRNS